MELYFSPLSCSAATRIALYEVGVPATFVQVDRTTKLTELGDDLRTLNPLGLVPTLRTDDGEVLTEIAAILHYIADLRPTANLAPNAGMERVRLAQWLCFIGTELHKGIFNPLFDPNAPEASKRYALEKSASRLAVVEAHLAGRDHLLADFSIADAYLVTVLGWTLATPIDLKRWRALSAYSARLRERPSVARAFAEERPLYLREHAAASASR